MGLKNLIVVGAALFAGAGAALAQSTPPTGVPSMEAASPGSSIVLFDQSGSMGGYDPLEISKIWLVTFAQTLEGDHNVRLVGFDEDVHEPIALTLGPKADMETIESKLSQIKTRGKVTDLESPLRFLAGLDDIDDVELILIISDGKPEIWDRNMAYLSPSVLNDPRYGVLNARYDELKKNAIAEGEILKRLGPEYHARNLELIESRLGEMAPKIGLKTVLWDVSGESKSFRKWSQGLGAEYMAARIKESEEPVTQLLYALLKLQERAATLVGESKPGDEQLRYDSTLSAVLAAENQRLNPVPEPQPPQPPAPKAPAEPVIEEPPAPKPVVAVVPDEPEMAPIPTPMPSPTLSPAYGASPTQQGRLLAGGVLFVGLILVIASLTWLLGRGAMRISGAASEPDAIPS